MHESYIKEFGFVYIEEYVSTDGSLKVIYGNSDGERSPLLIEPRVVDATSGKIYLDLWRLAFNGAVTFGDIGTFRIKVDDPFRAVTVCEAEVDVRTETFQIPQISKHPEPLSTFRMRVHRLSGR